jgi:hypothetical protein
MRARVSASHDHPAGLMRDCGGHHWHCPWSRLFWVSSLRGFPFETASVPPLPEGRRFVRPGRVLSHAESVAEGLPTSDGVRAGGKSVSSRSWCERGERPLRVRPRDLVDDPGSRAPSRPPLPSAWFPSGTASGYRRCVPSTARWSRKTPRTTSFAAEVVDGREAADQPRGSWTAPTR